MESEVALTVVAAAEVVAETSQLIIRVHQPDRGLAADGDIHATAIAKAKALLLETTCRIDPSCVIVALLQKFKSPPSSNTSAFPQVSVRTCPIRFSLGGISPQGG